jgi:hypothetical protein
VDRGQQLADGHVVPSFSSKIACALSRRCTTGYGVGHPRRKTDFACRIKLIWAVNSPPEKYSTSIFQKYMVV